jgi:predicted nuclease of restriction endonuclease-like (RecB) superfamily
MAKKGNIVEKPEDVIKDIYTLEFLDLPTDDKWDESDLEKIF